MGATSGIRQLLRDLRTQKLRTFLTAFGIVWGTAAVSLLLAFGEGVHKAWLQRIWQTASSLLVCTQPGCFINHEKSGLT